MNIKKILAPALLLLGAAGFFTACGGGDTAQTTDSPLQIAQAILDTQEGFSGAYALTPEDGEFAAYLSAYYQLEGDLPEDGAIFYMGGADAAEIAVLALADPADAALAEAALLDYIDARIGEFYGYMPEQVFLLEQAAVAVNGSYVALLVCGEPEQARQAFDDCFGADAPSRAARVGPRAVYAAAVDDGGPCDTAAVLRAWRSGDDTGLSYKSGRVLAIATRVIDQEISDSMTDYEKELAIHDWIVRWAEYDVETKSRAPDAAPHPDNHNPYGLLIGRRAICTGYTETFQLFMDMLGIRCITVTGATRDTMNDHAWNMVRLDGEWYCVDVTWDDPVGLPAYDPAKQHRYFNVTSAYLRSNEHHWDAAAVPEATATKYRWKN